MKAIWIVAVDVTYYPYIVPFHTYLDAKVYYDSALLGSKKDNVYLANVVEQAND